MIRISDVRRVGSGGRMGKNARLLPSFKPKKVTHPTGPSGANADTLLVQLLTSAVKADATTVHLEPQGNDVVVRHRVDGLLRQEKVFKRKDFLTLVRHLKTLANLDANETRVPQDGRFDIAIGANHIVVRTNILPVADGEKVVLHPTDQSVQPNDLSQLGYWGHSLLAIQDVSAHARGLVIVCGPAGSGKSSTLYGLLRMAVNPSKSSMTVEDVVEHRLPGVNQTAVNTKAGLTFSETLRAALNQDPNILMLSDIRDPQAAHLVSDAALTGKYILAGIHTYDVAAAISRMAAMGVAPYLLATGITAVVNQRLVRKLCPNCREVYKPTADEVVSVIRDCGLNPAGALHRLIELEPAARKHFDSISTTAFENGRVVRLWRAKDGGCKACGGLGYSGRTAVTEVMPMSPTIQKLVLAAGSAESMYDQAIAEGMLPLPMDGLVKVMLGVTSSEELLRVITE